MREKLAELNVEMSEDEAFFDVLMEGCRGYNNIDDKDVVEEFERHFGEDYFDVVDEKDHKNGLYGED